MSENVTVSGNNVVNSSFLTTSLLHADFAERRN